MYAEGEGVSQDYTEALRWYHKAADQGYAKAQNNLGGMYDNGRGVAQDYAEAMRWYRKAADQGNAAAQTSLGENYEKGQGVAQDYVMAHMWHNLAASEATGDRQEKYAAARDDLAAKMTPEQIAEAQRLAREWKPRV